MASTRVAVRRLAGRPAALFGALVVAVMTAAAVMAPQFALHDPYQPALRTRFRPPLWAPGGSAQYPLGTDAVGRDVLSRLIYGARVSLSIGALAVLLPGTLGVMFGVLAGYSGGVVDSVIDNLASLMMAFPFMLLALAAVAVMRPSFQSIIVVLTATGWPVYARLIRAETLRYREMDFVAAARALGCGTPRLLLRHVMPNLVNTILVMASLEVPRMIILESFLSFLGVGIQPPTPTWGGMLSEGRAYLFDRWWLTLFPGSMIFLTTLGMNLFGDGLRDALDPRRVVVGVS